MQKFGFKIRTRGGMLLENLMIAGRDRNEAEAKVSQIYHHCEILECSEVQGIAPAKSGEGFNLEDAISLIGKQDSVS